MISQILSWMPLVSIGLALMPLTSGHAGTCASACGEAPLHFPPGSPVQVELVNFTANPVEVQESAGSQPIPLLPGQTLRLDRWGTTIENTSIVFWDPLGLTLKATLEKPEVDLLRIELSPDHTILGDRSVYLRDDGRLDRF